VHQNITAGDREGKGGMEQTYNIREGREYDEEEDGGLERKMGGQGGARGRLRRKKRL
jgi:hypothetical protein